MTLTANDSDSALALGGLVIWSLYIILHILWRYVKDVSDLDREKIRFRFLALLISLFYSCVVLARVANTGRNELVIPVAVTMGLSFGAYFIMMVGAFRPNKLQCCNAT